MRFIPRQSYFQNIEIFALASQMQRCAVSIPANIAESAGRNTDNEFARFLEYAISSAYELETELLIAYNQHYIEEVKYIKLQNTLIEI